MKAVWSQVACDTCGRVTRNEYRGKKDATAESGCRFAGNITYATVKCPFGPSGIEAKYSSYWLPKWGEKGDPPPCAGCGSSLFCVCPRAPKEQWRSSTWFLWDERRKEFFMMSIPETRHFKFFNLSYDCMR